ncbi:A disintegrin and metalloproteinase with thrombospondin motifs 2-like, partial [Elysia marginata]
MESGLGGSKYGTGLNASTEVLNLDLDQDMVNGNFGEIPRSLLEQPPTPLEKNDFTLEGDLLYGHRHRHHRHIGSSRRGEKKSSGGISSSRAQQESYLKARSRTYPQYRWKRSVSHTAEGGLLESRGDFQKDVSYSLHPGPASMSPESVGIDRDRDYKGDNYDLKKALTFKANSRDDVVSMSVAETLHYNYQTQIPINHVVDSSVSAYALHRHPFESRSNDESSDAKPVFSGVITWRNSIARLASTLSSTFSPLLFFSFFPPSLSPSSTSLPPSEKDLRQSSTPSSTVYSKTSSTTKTSSSPWSTAATASPLPSSQEVAAATAATTTSSLNNDNNRTLGSNLYQNLLLIPDKEISRTLQSDSMATAHKGSQNVAINSTDTNMHLNMDDAVKPNQTLSRSRRSARSSRSQDNRYNSRLERSERLRMLRASIRRGRPRRRARRLPTAKAVVRRRRLPRVDAKIGVLVVVDNSIYRQYLKDNKYDRRVALAKIKRYYGMVFAMMDQRFGTIDHPSLSISVSISGILVAESREDASWLEQLIDWSTVSSHGRASFHTDKALRQFSAWIINQKGLPKYDHAMVFTGYRLSSRQGVGLG